MNKVLTVLVALSACALTAPVYGPLVQIILNIENTSHKPIPVPPHHEKPEVFPDNLISPEEVHVTPETPEPAGGPDNYPPEPDHGEIIDVGDNFPPKPEHEDNVDVADNYPPKPESGESVEVQDNHPPATGHGDSNEVDNVPIKPENPGSIEIIDVVPPKPDLEESVDVDDSSSSSSESTESLESVENVPSKPENGDSIDIEDLPDKPDGSDSVDDNSSDIEVDHFPILESSGEGSGDEIDVSSEGSGTEPESHESDHTDGSGSFDRHEVDGLEDHEHFMTSVFLEDVDESIEQFNKVEDIQNVSLQHEIKTESKESIENEPETLNEYLSVTAEDLKFKGDLIETIPKNVQNTQATNLDKHKENNPDPTNILKEDTQKPDKSIGPADKAIGNESRAENEESSFVSHLWSSLKTGFGLWG